jgi:triphosphoribosyl-dephospho-CoA synthase
MDLEESPGSTSPGLLAQVACLLEVTARKPGNVHRGSDFADSHLLDFLLSAAAIAGPLDRASRIGVGLAVREAVEATRRVVATNTNLGMVLLLAPLAAVPRDRPLPEGVADVLAATTIDDARAVYGAIRRAHPGGLGTVADQDVAGEPTLTLLEVMRLAADRDLVARQYAGAYREVFGEAVPALRDALAAGRPLETAIIHSYLNVLANHPDTLIARKRGRDEAHLASRRAADVLAAGWPDSPAGRTLCDELDTWLRGDGHARNPGATADLITAALFVALRDGTIPLPRPAGPSGWSLPLAD